MDDDEQPLTPNALYRMVESKRAVAYAVVENKVACRDAWMAAGYAVEFALKAYIIKRERLNGWPSREARPELYTHDLRSLFAAAEIDLKLAPKPLRGSLRTVMDWNRAHEYASGQMARANARSMVRAALDPNGVVAWLRILG